MKFKVFIKFLPLIILILIWVLPMSIYIRIPVTGLIGLDLQRTYFPEKKGDKTLDE